MAAFSGQTMSDFISVHIHKRQNLLKGDLNIGNQAIQKPYDVPSRAVCMPPPFMIRIGISLNSSNKQRKQSRAQHRSLWDTLVNLNFPETVSLNFNVSGLQEGIDS
ncbi:hypothetical protein HNY73_003975 [Argiope bruennichi]|uniref:Uncharacterized protein n=1 Tax=Argiope bruennichi TaxID=94029 RepID=A0A8T0FP79_ARGBR|nr:hypothetical protein HNY73_003975 [Argiope bruennichi]